MAANRLQPDRDRQGGHAGDPPPVIRLDVVQDLDPRLVAVRLDTQADHGVEGDLGFTGDGEEAERALLDATLLMGLHERMSTSAPVRVERRRASVSRSVILPEI